MCSAGQKHLYDYYIDEQGNWFCESNPVTDPGLFRLLSRSLFQKGDRFYVRCEGEVHPVRTADAPLRVRYVHVQTDPQGELTAVEIELQDGRREPLAADTLAVAGNEALYCEATHRRLRARFGKVAYYELTRYLRWESGTNIYYFLIGNKRYDIKADL